VRPWRVALAVVGSALPLLGVVLWASAGRGATAAVTAALLWIACVGLVTLVVWRRLGAPLADVTQELDTASAAEARWLLRDLKERAALCQSERDRMAELLQDLSSSLGEGLLVVTEELEIRLVSPVALRFCGADGVASGSHLLEIMRDPEVVKVVESAAAGERPGPVIVENARGLWELRAFPVRHGGAVVLVSDVSLVRRASELRRRFVQDLSHELRSPLAVLRTTVEAHESEVGSDLCDVLVRQVERIDRLVNELQELANIETGQVELRLEGVSLSPLVREVVRDFAPEAERVGVEVRTDVGEDVVALCDRRGLYRVLSNLVDNAVKYNRQGGWVEVSTTVESGSVVLTVADSGLGIPATELKAVLQRFYRLDRARTPGQSGLGLGLAIVKHMVQHMGGTLELDSQEGLGTRVTLRFAVSENGEQLTLPTT
jgi:signal transduction histidine kinase